MPKWWGRGERDDHESELVSSRRLEVSGTSMSHAAAAVSAATLEGAPSSETRLSGVRSFIASSFSWLSTVSTGSCPYAKDAVANSSGDRMTCPFAAGATKLPEGHPAVLPPGHPAVPGMAPRNSATDGGSSGDGSGGGDARPLSARLLGSGPVLVRPREQPASATWDDGVD